MTKAAELNSRGDRMKNLLKTLSDKVNVKCDVCFRYNEIGDFNVEIWADVNGKQLSLIKTLKPEMIEDYILEGFAHEFNRKTKSQPSGK